MGFVQMNKIITILMTCLLLIPCHSASAQDAEMPDYDPRDLSGVWGATPSRGPRFNYGMEVPPPALTEWGMENLRMESITHPAVGDRNAIATLNGVPTNTLGGQYPGKNCEPLGMPGNLEYVEFGPFEFIHSRSDDRIIQMMEYHREWRTLWMSDEHSEDIYPSYMGNSVAHWEGNTLVVDTIGFNGLTQITQGVGHRPSDAFHLVERYSRVSYDRLELEMDLFDEKAWGDAGWTGLKKTFSLMLGEQLQEFICVPSELSEFDETLEQATVD